MNDKIILDFNALSKLIKQKKLSPSAEKYIYFMWLGLTEREISTACYNSAAKTIGLDDRTVFVKEEAIEKFLASDNGKPFSFEELSLARYELERAEILPEDIYRSGFFNLRFEQSVLGQPEDSVCMREMKRNIKCSSKVLEKEYEKYLEMRKTNSARK